jgi:hypothetical protein
VRELDGGAHDDRAVPLGGEAGDERPVDFELVGGQTLEVGQRGVAGAEIVDRDLFSHGVQSVEDGRSGDQRAFGELEDQALRFGAPSVGQLGDRLGKGAGGAQAVSRDVDGHRELDALVVPGTLLAQGFV